MNNKCVENKEWYEKATKREYDKIREYISCPQFGDDHYGKWGALTLEQRIRIKHLFDCTKDLEKQILIMEKYFELIINLSFDYDGFSKEKDLKGLIDEMARLASLGRACNTTEAIYIDNGKQFTILGERLEEK